MHKYADDTYIVIPATNAESKEAELVHVDEWAQRNYLKLNCAKSIEIVFEDCRRKSRTLFPHTLTDFHRVTQIKIFGVTITNNLSISEHVSDAICKCGH